MTKEELLSHIDHTLLRPDATSAEIARLCEEGASFHTASVCIPPRFVKEAAAQLRGRCRVCTVIGFPNGYHTTAVKLAEAKDAIANGADELDVVIPIGEVKAGNFDAVKEELSLLRAATAGKTLKVIIETCMLTEAEKIALCKIVSESGAEYIKTSTGFGAAGATEEDIRLFVRHCTGIRIKAAGGIRTVADAERFLSLGADRIGSSALVKECGA